MCDSTSVIYNPFINGTCSYLHNLPVTPQAPLPNVVMGLVLIATFLSTMYNVNEHTKRALAGVSDSNVLSFSIYITFMQASSVWAIVWAVYKLFSVNPAHNTWVVWHAIMTSLVLSLSILFESSVCLFLTLESVGVQAFQLTGIYSILLSVCNFAPSIYISLRYPGNTQDLDSPQELLYYIYSEAFLALAYLVIVIRYYFAKSKRKALLFYCTFLISIYMLRIAGNTVLYLNYDMGICIRDISWLVYFGFFATVLYHTLLTDSRYWIALLTGQSPVQSSLDSDSIPHHDVLIPSNQLLFVKSLDWGAGGVVDLYLWRGRSVVVKKLTLRLMTKAYLDGFAREAGILRELQHPNVVEFLGVFFDPPRLGIVMEFCQRGSLFQVLQTRAFDKEHFSPIKVAIDIAHGMAYLQQQKYIHRDLKSLNVLIDSKWNAKVTDFGECRQFKEPIVTTSIHGTPAYVAPEVLAQRPVTFKTDVYSFGIVLWEILTCRAPFVRPRQLEMDVASPALSGPRARAMSADSYHSVRHHHSSFSSLDRRSRKEEGRASVFEDVEKKDDEKWLNAFDAAHDAEIKRENDMNQPLLKPSSVEVRIETLRAAYQYIGDSELRPPLPQFCPPPLLELLQRCWSQDPDQRPSFDEIVQILDEFIVHSTPEDFTNYPFPV